MIPNQREFCCVIVWKNKIAQKYTVRGKFFLQISNKLCFLLLAVENVFW
jgi:hypothetical protein